ncbi:MAG: DUF2283 domain-containing protein [Deltaproteobacteria bacterium]|nr:DUF2283 domain-containing protein [Deltaproteobacteria bacterium]
MATDAINKEMIDSCLGLSSQLVRLPVKHIWVDYDEEADVLYLSFRKPQRAKKTIEMDDDVLIRTDDNQIVGITIMNASSK